MLTDLEVLRKHSKNKPNSTCIIWTGFLNNRGYGQIVRQRKGKSKFYIAHRLSYELTYGQIPDKYHIDHICRERSCINPVHLRAVTCKENIMAQGSLALAKRNKTATHCKHGHEFTAENTYIRATGDRQCKPCTLLRGLKRREAHFATT